VRWDEAKFGPLPEEAENYQLGEDRSDFSDEWNAGYEAARDLADAAIAALADKLANSIEWGRIEQKRKQEAEEREHDAIVRAEQAEAEPRRWSAAGTAGTRDASYTSEAPASSAISHGKEEN